MGWGTQFSADIFLSRERIENIYDLEREIQDVEKDIRTIRERILMYCSAGVNAGIRKDCEGNDLEPIFCIHQDITELFEWYEESIAKTVKLNLMKEDWDEKEKKFKTAFIG